MVRLERDLPALEPAMSASRLVWQAEMKSGGVRGARVDRACCRGVALRERRPSAAATLTRQCGGGRSCSP